MRTIFSKPLPPSPKIIYIGVCGAGGLLDANECYTHGGWYDPATIPAFAYDNPLRDDDLNDIALTVNSGLDSIGLRIGALFTNSVTIVAGFDLGLAPFGSSVVTDLVRSFYVPGDQIYLAGHSMGGYIVDNVAAALKRAKVPVQAVLQLDSVRPSKAIALPPPSIPSNVHRAFNVYHSCDLSACPICGYSTIVTTASTVVSNLAIVAPEGPDTLAGCGPHRNMDNDPRGWRPFMDYIIATFSNTVHASVAVTRKTTTRENTQSLE